MKRRLLLILALFALTALQSAGYVFADGEAGGTDSGSTVTDCSKFHNALVELCDWDGSGYSEGGEGWAGGGKSWRIFKVGSGGYYSRNEIHDIQGVWPVILEEDTPVSEVESQCKREGAEYYVAFGWDRPWRHQENNNYLGGLSGIAKRTSGNDINYAKWNLVFKNRRAYTWDEIRGMSNAELDAAGAADSSHRTGMKITVDAANKLHRQGDFSSSNIPDDVGAFCASFDEFEGRSRALDGSTVKASTGYVQQSKQVIYQISDCSASGCTAKIQHHLKRTHGGGGTTYKIKRTTSNISGYGEGTIKNTTTETFSSNSEVKEREASYTLLPGQIVCETLIFDANASTKNVKTTACVSANKSTSGEPEIKIEAKNADGAAAYQGYTHTVYTKPGDALSYRATYTPSPDQVFYTSVPEKYSLNGGTTSPSGTTKNTTQLGSISAIGWKNAFNVKINFASVYDHNYTYTKGQTDGKTEYRDHTTSTDEVGANLSGVAKLNNVSGVKNTPTRVAFSTMEVSLSSKDSDTDMTTEYFTKADVTAASPDDTANVYVPYNFTNTTVVDSDEENLTMYAGETAAIHYRYIINPKGNSRTTNSSEVKYATTVRNPKWKLELCVTGGSCYETSEKTQSAYTVSLTEMYNVKQYSKETTISVPDEKAGTEVCVRSAVYPANSGADTNWSNPNGSDSWAYSEPKCFTVAKKPSLQVWGGNVYSNGAIEGQEATKTSLEEVSGNDYNINSTDVKHVFGSWGELGVLANDTVKWFASGASLGYELGSTSADFCDHVPLSFANSQCNTSKETGSLGSSIMDASMNGDQDNVLLKFDFGETNEVTGEVSLNDGTKVKGNAYYYYGQNLTIPASTIQKGTIQFVHEKSKVYISGDITYEDVGYRLMSDVPKLVIYSEGDINIGCEVKRVDAVLVAAGTVRTCANENGEVADVDAQERSRGQLQINGAVMAARLEATRTYGAATGTNSIVPAEIINFDPTLYRWGQPTISNDDGTQEVTDTDVNLNVTYQRELAPRL